MTITGTAYIRAADDGATMLTTRSALGWTLAVEVEHDVIGTLAAMGWQPVEVVPESVSSHFEIERI